MHNFASDYPSCPYTTCVNPDCFERCSVKLIKPPLGPVPDFVNQPQHYARWPMQPIEFIAVNSLPFWMANVIKYICRHDAKDGLQDLRKARSYLDMEIRRLEGIERWWEKPVADERKANNK